MNFREEGKYSRLNRREFAKTSLLLAGLTGGVPPVKAADNKRIVSERRFERVTDSFVISQKDEWTNIDPVSNSSEVSDWFSSPFDIPSDFPWLEEGDSEPKYSQLLFYDGPAGRNLTFAHQRDTFDATGAVTFDVSGLPAKGDWVLKKNMDIDEGFGSVKLDWEWDNVNIGAGGAYSAEFDYDTRLKIQPQSWNEITHWEAVNDSEDDRLLSMDDDVSIAPQYEFEEGRQAGKELLNEIRAELNTVLDEERISRAFESPENFLDELYEEYPNIGYKKLLQNEEAMERQIIVSDVTKTYSKIMVPLSLATAKGITTAIIAVATFGVLNSGKYLKKADLGDTFIGRKLRSLAKSIESIINDIKNRILSVNYFTGSRKSRILEIIEDAEQYMQNFIEDNRKGLLDIGSTLASLNFVNLSTLIKPELRNELGSFVEDKTNITHESTLKEALLTGQKEYSFRSDKEIPIGIKPLLENAVGQLRSSIDQSNLSIEGHTFRVNEAKRVKREAIDETERHLSRLSTLDDIIEGLGIIEILMLFAAAFLQLIKMVRSGSTLSETSRTRIVNLVKGLTAWAKRIGYVGLTAVGLRSEAGRIPMVDTSKSLMSIVELEVNHRT